MASIRKLENRKTKPWRVEIRRKGSDPISQTFRTRREASEFAAKVEADFDKWGRILGGELRRYSFADLCDRYIRRYQGKDPSVVTRLGWWRDQYGERLLSEVNGETVREGISQLAEGTARQGGSAITKTERKLSPATINRYRTAISIAYRTAIDQGWFGIRENPAAGIRQRKENNNRFGRSLGDGERARLLAACDESTTWPALGTFVRVALATGARRGELLKLQWSDVDLKRGAILLRDTKNADDRAVPLIDEARERLAVLAKVRRLDDPRVFPGSAPHRPPPLDAAWTAAKVAAEVENLRIHDLRHSCGSYLAKAGASAFQIAAVLGHRSGPGLTQRYVHLVAEDSRELLEAALGSILEPKA